ncbi:FH2 domain-containing 1 [Labeo rohita]|uniref:Secreted frizzled-related protein 2 n=1 Tax=Labeo rohita TaxID=84645 RepID=A0A498LEH0_LABRO|nr:FH2 domain-containing 1 [Labeo rohita]
MMLAYLALLVALCLPGYLDALHGFAFDQPELFQKKSNCKPIPANLLLCHDIEYTDMRLPNLLGHETMNEVLQQASSWTPLVQKQCHKDTKKFLCSLFAPVCLDDVDEPIQPCRSLCESVKSGCAPVMAAFGFPWPDMLNCSRFPLDNDLCIPPAGADALVPVTKEVPRVCEACKEKPENDNEIVDSLCKNDFALKIKVKEISYMNGDTKIIPETKSKTIYKLNGGVTDRDFRKIVLWLKDGLQCVCDEMNDINAAYLVMGQKMDGNLVITSLKRWQKGMSEASFDSGKNASQDNQSDPNEQGHQNTADSVAMAEEAHRSPAAQISVTRNGEADKSHDEVFHRDVPHNISSGPIASHSHNSPENYAVNEGVVQVGQYSGSPFQATTPKVVPSPAAASRLARSISDSQVETRKGALREQQTGGAVVLADDMKSPAIEKLELVKKWSINTYKCTKQILSEKLGRGSRTVDLELEAQIEVLRDNKRKYEHVIKLAQTLCTQLAQMLQTQRQLGDAFADLSLKTPELHEEFGYNAETQKLLAKNGETLLGAINFFISNVKTLVDKTIEDTLINIKQYEAARIEYDAYRTDLEELNLGPRDANTLPKIELSQQQFQIHREKYEKMRNDVSVKLKFLEENKISILDSKRGMNIGIFLKQFKKSNHAIVEDISLGNSKQYGAEPLKELLKLLPEAEEVKRLKEFKGDPNKLTLVDSFMFLLIQVPRFDVRIEAMVLQEEFVPSCAAMSREINIVRQATEELMTCEELHAILHLVLQAGNIMNAGGYAGNAVGFKLSSLLSLADTKANKPGMNLLHFVALEAEKKDEALLKFPEKLTHVQSAARISVENIEGEFSSLYVKTRSLEQKIQDDDELQKQLDPFLEALQDLKHRRLDLRKEGNALIDFFCEDKDTFKLDECFRIFQDFCLKFKKAVKDNRDRELKEEARQRRLRELEERRCAWGAANTEAGGFGRSSSENDVDILTKEGLLDFLLQSRPQSPHSPLGRSASARRYHHTELISGSSPSDHTKFSSLPRPTRNHQRKTMAWLVLQDDNRELGPQSQVYQEKLATSPKAETEPISPLARYSNFGHNMNNDPYNNNNYSSLSEGGVTPQLSNPKHVFQGTPGQNVGHMNVSVEKHKLVTGLQPFEITSQINNNSHVSMDNQNVFVTDLEREEDSPRAFVLDTPPSSRSSEERPKPEKVWNDTRISSQREEADTSTFSSTTCDTPLPLDPSMSSKKPALYVMDCTETDCSIVLDCSEIESSPIIKEKSELKSQDASFPRVIQDTNSLSSNFESTDCHFVSTSGEELIAGRVNQACPESFSPSVTTEEAETDSCDTAEGRKVGEKAVQTGSPKTTLVKARTSSKVTAHASRPTRTLTPTETQNMRKVVPITRQNRSSSSMRKVEKPAGYENTEPRRPLRDQSMPARRGERQGRPARHSSLPPEDPRVQRGATPSNSRWSRDLTQHRPSIKKTNSRPVRNISKPAPEEKMCRSTMRALAQAQAQAQAQGTSEGGTPDSPSSTVKSSSPLPSFARNTVASSSRSKKDLPSPAVTGTPSKSLARASSQRLPGGRTDSVSSGPLPRSEDKLGGSIRRVQSVRASNRSSDTPSPQSGREHPLKSSSFSERSTQIRDSISSRTNKPTWK